MKDPLPPWADVLCRAVGVGLGLGVALAGSALAVAVVGRVIL